MTRPHLGRYLGGMGITLLAMTTALPQPAAAQQSQPLPTSERGEQADDQRSPNNPRRESNRRHDRPDFDPSSLGTVYRSIDGSGNNADNPAWGAAGIEFLRLAPADYTDGVDSPSGSSRPSARQISNVCMEEVEPTENGSRASDFLWLWGQFLDHDITLTPIAEPAETFNIQVPAGDAWFDPAGQGTEEIPLERSSYEHDTDGVRQQVNEITAFIDASNVYGSDDERARALRTLDDTGRLATSDGDLLPFNTQGLPNAPSTSDEFFLAGDFRANEQVTLTAMHVLFVREHNHWAEEIASSNPELSGEEIYQLARVIVGAEMQAITYREFLPVLLGDDALGPYRGYSPTTDPSIANEFATAAYRVGHTMLSSSILRLEADGSESPEGPLALADAFFNPSLLASPALESMIRGLAEQRARDVDLAIVDDVRNFLFGPPGAGGFDLASLNIQRGRDHGLASYNDTREAYGMRRHRRFEDITTDRSVQRQLRDAYVSVDDIDLWVGGLAEEHVPGAMVGETFRAILVDQFQRLRDGDSFWYERVLPRSMIDLIEDQTLSRIVERNSDVRGLQRDLFLVDRGPRS